MEIGAKGYKDTFVHFQITGNQQAEEKAQYLQYLEILVLNKKLKLSLKNKQTKKKNAVLYPDYLDLISSQEWIF